MATRKKAQAEDDVDEQIASVQSMLEAADAQHEVDDDEPKQAELFIAPSGPTDLSVKGDVSSMEFPIFSLSKKKDTRIRTYSRAGRTVKVIPSVVGSANVFDKDILIYAMSQLAKAADAGLPTSRRIRIESHAFLKSTNRSTGGASYGRIVETCRRLKGTVVETNVRTTESEKTQGFSLIEDYTVSRYTKSGTGALEIEITISDWMYRAVLEYNILSMSPRYFKLTQSIERRLYELARKHCGDKPWWKINLPLLQEKCGSSQRAKFFTNDLRKIIKSDSLPEYRIALEDTCRPYQVVFISRDSKKVFDEAKKLNQWEWISTLLQRTLAK